MPVKGNFTGMALVREQGSVSFHDVSRPLYRSNNPPGLHAMILECYFDDSSDDRREKYFACGGLLGTPEQWDYFDVLWNTATRGLSEPFRSTDCENGYGQFKDWPIPERQKLMARLTTVVSRLRLFGYASIIPIAEFKAVFPNLGEREAARSVLAHVIVNMASLANRMGTDVAIWFEKGSYSSASHGIFDSLQAKEWKPAQRLRGPFFENKQLRPLQSADLVAREAFKHIDNLGVRPMRKSLIKISETQFFMLWNRGTLEHFRANGGPENLNALWESTDMPDAAKLTHFSWYESWKKYEKKGAYKSFERAVDSLLKVTHAEITTKLEEEKQAKKRKKSKKSSASRGAV